VSGAHVSLPSDTSETLAMPGGVVVRVFARTDVGRTREHNEDAFLVADLRAPEPLRFGEPGDASTGPYEVNGAGYPGMLFIVADGLGGAAAGEVASHMAVQTVFDALRSRLDTNSQDPAHFATALRDATLAANTAIHQHAQRHRELHGMGTTVTAAALLGDTLYVSQVGDSRAYIVRNGRAQQITKDQSLMQKLVEAGEITPEQAELSARRNIILQALGPESTVKIDLTHQPVRRGDLLLLCSDGLSGQVKPDELAQTAAAASDLDALCETLIARANEQGGPDNITVVAVRFDGDGLASPVAEDAVGHRIFSIGGEEQDTLRLRTAELPQARLEAMSPLPPVPIPPVPLPPAPPALPEQALVERRERARAYYVALAVAAVIVAAFTLWRMLRA